MARRAKSFLPPAGQLDATIVSWGKGQQLHRVHDAIYSGNGFKRHSLLFSVVTGRTTPGHRDRGTRRRAIR